MCYGILSCLTKEKLSLLFADLGSSGIESRSALAIERVDRLRASILNAPEQVLPQEGSLHANSNTLTPTIDDGGPQSPTCATTQLGETMSGDEHLQYIKASAGERLNEMVGEDQDDNDLSSSFAAESLELQPSFSTRLRSSPVRGAHAVTAVLYIHCALLRVQPTGCCCVRLRRASSTADCLAVVSEESDISAGSCSSRSSPSASSD